MQDVVRLVQNAADAEDDDDEEEDDVPVKPSLSRPGKRGMRAAGAVGPPSQKSTVLFCRSDVEAWHQMCHAMQTHVCLQLYLRGVKGCQHATKHAGQSGRHLLGMAAACCSSAGVENPSCAASSIVFKMLPQMLLWRLWCYAWLE